MKIVNGGKGGRGQMDKRREEGYRGKGGRGQMEEREEEGNWK